MKASDTTSQNGVITLAVTVALLAGVLWLYPILFSDKPSSNQESLSHTNPEIDSQIYVHKVVELRPLLDLQSFDSSNKEFWSFIQTFNTLPKTPNRSQIKAFEAKGEAKIFNYISFPTHPIELSIPKLIEHAKEFRTRYSWSKEKLELVRLEEIDLSSMVEIKKQCWISLSPHKNISNYMEYEKKFLAYVLIADYLASKGSKTDKIAALELLKTLYATSMFLTTDEKKEESGVVISAARDLYHPLMNDFRYEVSDQMVRQLYACYKNREDKTLYVNYLLWIHRARLPCLTAAAFQGLRETFLIELNNILVDLEMPEYAIYVLHSFFQSERLPDSYQKIVKHNLLKKMNQPELYKKYKDLL